MECVGGSGGSIGNARSAICQRHVGQCQGIDDGTHHICDVARESWLADRGLEDWRWEWRFVGVVIDGVVNMADIDVENRVLSVPLMFYKNLDVRTFTSFAFFL